jgi:hypothetical protein
MAQPVQDVAPVAGNPLVLPSREPRFFGFNPRPDTYRRPQTYQRFGWHCLSRPTSAEACDMQAQQECAGWEGHCQQNLPPLLPPRATRAGALVVCVPPKPDPDYSRPRQYAYRPPVAMSVGQSADYSAMCPKPQAMRMMAIPNSDSDAVGRVVDITQNEWMVVIYGLGCLLLVLGVVLGLVYWGRI